MMSPPSTNLDNPAVSSSGGADSSNDHNDDGVFSAVELIRQLDTAFAQVNTNIVSNVREIEEARNNAKIASELARRFAKGGSSVVADTSNMDGFFSRSLLWNPNNEEQQQQQALSSDYGSPSFSSPQRPPPAPPKIMMSNDSVNSSSSINSNRRIPLQPRSTKSTSSSVIRTNKTERRHAEELLQVTMELEQIKQLYEKEQMEHDETKATLQQTNIKYNTIQNQMDEMLNNIETQREENGRIIDELQNEVEHYKNRMNIAEEDAQLASDIAFEKNQYAINCKQQVESLLDKIDEYKDYINQLLSERNNNDDDREEGKFESPQYPSPRRVHFSDPLDDSNSKNRPNKALVAAGRQLLMQFRSKQQQQAQQETTSSTYANKEDDDEQDNVQETKTYGFYEQQSTVVTTSSDTYQRLKEHLEQRMEYDIEQEEKDERTSSSTQKRRRRSMLEAMEIIKNSAQILKQSGNRLHLSGQWFSSLSKNNNNNNDDDTNTSTVHDEFHLETIARQYTALVEIQLDRKHKEVLELESLCALLEDGRVSPRNDNTRNNNANNNTATTMWDDDDK